MKTQDTGIEAVKLIHQFRADDQRGSFVKTFHHSSLKAQGIDFELRESFYSVSVKDVIRGMHFHHPPYDHDKVVFCTEGVILDVALDLRKEAGTYGQCVSAELSFENNQALFIPKGFAHGFLTLSESATTFYLVSGEYNQQADDGVRFDSIAFNWPVKQAIVSERDRLFTSLNEFHSPF
jgi:dTDP-4-dehydrorhamnose 3,5-epimerase/CDP-3, 6-dideoxy-D-glycero-D-glycero-4-hexulose-5-epimerase